MLLLFLSDMHYSIHKDRGRAKVRIEGLDYSVRSVFAMQEKESDVCHGGEG